eukprot:6214480-Pleurochrysis_carterae.AAC.2
MGRLKASRLRVGCWMSLLLPSSTGVASLALAHGGSTVGIPRADPLVRTLSTGCPSYGGRCSL